MDTVINELDHDATVAADLIQELPSGSCRL
jgi:hypothetical protein